MLKRIELAVACALFAFPLGSLGGVHADAMPGGNTDTYEDTWNLAPPIISPTSVASSLYGGSTYAVGQRYGCTSYAPEGTASGHHQCPLSNPYWHHGIDISVPTNTQLYSTFSGTVREICNPTGARNGMSITTGPGTIVYLVHGTVDPGINVGDAITYGQRFYHSDGNVSCWGGSIDGAHLHFEVHRSLTFSQGGLWDDINPEVWLALSTPCTSADASAAPTFPRPAGTQVTITASFAGCANPYYEFWARWQGSSNWQLLRGYSTSPTYIWNSTGAAAGTETFVVWVIDSGSGGINTNPAIGAGAYDATSASISYSVTVTPCAWAGINAGPTSPQPSGTQVTFTGSSTICTSPLYAFYARWQGDPTWYLLQAYSPSKTYVWNSTGAAAGTEYFGVWAKDTSSSTATFDANASMAYTVTGVAPCTSVTVTRQPPSPQLVGTTVTLTATATGCPNPLYEFAAQWVGTTVFQEVQPYSTNPAYIWDSTGAAPGTEYFRAWARDSGSSASYDATVTVPYTVN